MKPTFAVGFGFRVSIGPGEVKSSESVSGFGFRSVLGKVYSLQSRFRVSGFGFRSALGKLSLQSRFRVSGFGFRSVLGKVEVFRVGFGFRVSDFGFRVSIGPGEGKSSESVSGFGFRSVLGKLSLQSRFRVSGFGFCSSKPTLTVGFGFRVSGFAGRNQLCRPLSGSRLSLSPWQNTSTNFCGRSVAPPLGGAAIHWFPARWILHDWLIGQLVVQRFGSSLALGALMTREELLRGC